MHKHEHLTQYGEIAVKSAFPVVSMTLVKAVRFLPRVSTPRLVMYWPIAVVVVVLSIGTTMIIKFHTKMWKNTSSNALTSLAHVHSPDKLPTLQLIRNYSGVINRTIVCTACGKQIGEQQIEWI